MLTLKKVLTSLKSKIYHLEDYIKKLIEWAFCKDSAKVIDRDAYFLLFLSFNVLMIESQFCNKNNFHEFIDRRYRFGNCLAELNLYAIMNLLLQRFLCIFGIQNISWKFSSLVLILNYNFFECSTAFFDSFIFPNFDLVEIFFSSAIMSSFNITSMW